jgi:putative zinc finger protein
MLSCADFLAEFGDYLENLADPDLRARLEEHLRECKTCQVIVDSTKKTIRIVTDSDSFSVPADNVESIVKDVMARIRDRKR